MTQFRDKPLVSHVRGEKWRSRISAVSATVIAMCCAQSALGQTAPVEAQSTSGIPQSTETSQSSDIIVTAQRSNEQLKDVPVPVTVLTAEALTQRGDYKLEDYFSSVPGLALQSNGRGFNGLVIRGIATGTDNTPTVAIYLDETPLGSATAQARGDQLAPDLDPADLKQVEVLKGPQGTLYGSSAMGGLVKFTTIPPSTQRTFGRISIDGTTVAGGNSGFGVRGSVNAPLSQDVAGLSVSGFYRRDPGFIDDFVSHKTNTNVVRAYGGRAALLVNAGDNTTIKLSALYQHQEGLGSQRADYDKNTLAPLYGDLQQVRLPGTETYKSILQVYNGTITHDFGGVSLVSSTSYADTNYHSVEDLTFLFSSLFAPLYGRTTLGVPLDQQIRTKRFTEEVRLTGDLTDSLSWLAGAYYTHESSRFLQQDQTADPVTGAPLALPILYLAVGDSTYREIAGFADFTYKVTPNFTVQAGVRYGSNRQLSLQTNDGLANDVNQLSQRSRDSAATYLVTAKYNLSTDAMVYGRVATGYRVGGPNIGIQGSGITEFGPDRTINYEIGAKAGLFENKIFIDMSAFYTSWDDIQLTTIDARANTFYVNGGKAVSKGVEVSTQWKPTAGLTFGANFAYTDAKITQNVTNLIFAPDGARLPYSPKYSFQATFDYSTPISDSLNAFVGGRYTYVGSRMSDFESDATRVRPELPAYDVFDLNAGVETAKYKLNFYVKNIGNSRGMLGNSFLTLDHSAPVSRTIIQPRTFGVTASAKF